LAVDAMEVIPHGFSHHRPETVSETIGLLSALDGRAIYAGGTELVQIMKMGLAEFDHLIDIKRVKDLGAIDVRDEAITVGATVTHYRLATDPVIADALPILASVAGGIGNIRVRVAGTLGGNLCFAEPHSDPSTLLVAIGADVLLSGPTGDKTMAVEDFLLSPYTTALSKDELLVGVRIPRPPSSTRISYHKVVFTERPIASVACRMDTTIDGVVDWRVTIGSVGDMPVTILFAEGQRSLATHGAEVAQSLAEAAVERCAAVGDQYGSEDYKRHLVGVLVRRSVRSIVESGRD
jgi:carbon-monoxide dehydrogenase medium subunit